MNLRKLIYSIGLPVFLLFSFASSAQEKVITGRVADSAGRGIPGVSVTVKNIPTKGTTTADNGSFSLSVPSTATTLVFSSVGYGYREEDVSGRNSVEVTLQSTAGSLNEVVMVAYGSRRKGDLTGSVTSISSKDFQKGVINSSEQLLLGKVAGLQITSGGGSAGGGSRIRIRNGASLNASNDPLIVVDGVPVEGNGLAGSASLLNTINPDDIESISVLKDASATALYGSRASNGVLIITTKKGTRGKVKFNFNSQASVSEIANKVDVLSAAEIRKIVTDDAIATGNNTYKNLLGSANTDWQDVIYQRAQGWDNNASASGTIAGLVPFRASLGYYYQEGILRTNRFNRLSSALNLSPRLFTDHLSINLNLRAVRTGNRFADEGAVGSAIAFDPTQPVFANNKYGGFYEWLQADGKPIDLSTRNPMALLYRHSTSEVNRLLSSIQLDYKLHFFPDLHIQANLASDFAHGEGNNNIDSAYATNYKTGGRKTFYKQKKRNTLADVSLFYNKDIKSINTKLDVLVGHSYQDFVTNVYNFPAFSYRAIADPNKPAKKDTIGGSEPTFPTDKPQNRLESYLGRVNLTVFNKYLLTASIRRDASSKFSENNRVGYFPAVALAWRLKDEFFINSHVVTDLKLRLGWGVTGQQDIGDNYGYLPRYAQSNSSAQYQFGNTFYSFLRPSAYDPDRKWETTTTSNIGLDFSFLNNRISGTVDVYKKETEDLLSVVPIAPGSNFDITLLTNVGNMENKGIEFTLNTTPVRNKMLTWDLGFNYTYNESRITNLLKQQDPSFKGIDVSGISGGTGNNIGKFAVGYAPYIFNVYKQIYDLNGKPIEGLYEDLNRDGKIDESDRYFYKKPAADVLLGASTQLTYQKFTLGLSAHGAFGNYAYNNFNSNNGVIRAIKNPINFIGNASSNYLETNFSNNQYLSDYYIENASFFRLDNINLGYNFGRVFRNAVNLNILGSIQNVFIATKYKGLDPETASDTGVNNTIYQRPRIYSLRANLDF